MNYSIYTRLLDKAPRKNSTVYCKINSHTPEQKAKYIKRGNDYGFAILDTPDLFVEAVSYWRYE